MEGQDMRNTNSFLTSASIVNLTPNISTISQVDISIVMPCLNEVEALDDCIENAREFLSICGSSGEIIVVDNGSTDGSPQFAEAKGVVVIHEQRKGYGNACRKGLSVAKGNLVIMADADGTYDFRDAVNFLIPLQNGYDIVIGSRIRGYITPRAMPWSHRYIGVPFLTWLLNRIANCDISDAHCGLRAFRRVSVQKLRLRTTGFEFTSETIIEAVKHGLTIQNVPISYYPRRGHSKLRTIRDGWSHLQLLLGYYFNLDNRPGRINL
jgi:glycosyltransferase involved in cell wall biosynthesis